MKKPNETCGATRNTSEFDHNIQCRHGATWMSRGCWGYSLVASCSITSNKCIYSTIVHTGKFNFCFQQLRTSSIHFLLPWKPIMKALFLQVSSMMRETEWLSDDPTLGWFSLRFSWWSALLSTMTPQFSSYSLFWFKLMSVKLIVCPFCASIFIVYEAWQSELYIWRPGMNWIDGFALMVVHSWWWGSPWGGIY